jgi:hypothetical protein
VVAFCYAYHADLDLLGHVYGPGSLPWRLQLAHIDRLAAGIADGLPAGGQLVVTADHGMVTVPEQNRLDFDTKPVLQADQDVDDARKLIPDLVVIRGLLLEHPTGTLITTVGTKDVEVRCLVPMLVWGACERRR